MDRLTPSRVYLRPQPAAAPVDYIRDQEKGGMITLPMRNLAIYTASKGANQGPQGIQGVPGTDQNSWFDTIIASASDPGSPLVTGGPKTHFRAPYALNLTQGYIRCSVSVAPTGAPLIVDVRIAGVSVFSSYLQIDVDTTTSVGSAAPAVLSTLYIPDDTEFTVHIMQTGSIIAGTGLKVAVTGIKTT